MGAGTSCGVWDGNVDKAQKERKAWIKNQPQPCGDTPRASSLPLSACGCTVISKWLSVQKERKRSSCSQISTENTALLVSILCPYYFQGDLRQLLIKTGLSIYTGWLEYRYILKLRSQRWSRKLMAHEPTLLCHHLGSAVSHFCKPFLKGSS